jgi:hypothetical protein
MKASKTRLIEIATKEGMKLVRVKKIFGKLAIHREWGEPASYRRLGKSRMSITHVPTGMCVVFVPPKDAVEVAQKLSTLNWDFVGNIPPETAAATKEILDEFTWPCRARDRQSSPKLKEL